MQKVNTLVVILSVSLLPIVCCCTEVFVKGQPEIVILTMKILSKVREPQLLIGMNYEYQLYDVL